MSIKISVGIICRNEEEHIGGTLKSIIRQSFDHDKYEIMVVDGNSEDKTREIAKNVLSKGNIRHKVLNEKDFGFYGPCFARNLVIDNSSRDSMYIAFIDADCIADKNWLKVLYDAVNGTPKNIAGAGGPRLIAKTSDKMEIVINAVLTSYIASGGNPAFSKQERKYLSSIANYNAIYKKEIIKKFRYDNSLIVSDDNEMNLRIHKAGYNFKYAPDAIIYHHETSSIAEFSHNMFSYGVNIANTVRKHKTVLRASVPFSLAILLYLIITIPTYIWIGWIALVPLALYILFILSVTAEVIAKTGITYSLITIILVPVQHISYAIGIIYNFLGKKSVRKK